MTEEWPECVLRYVKKTHLSISLHTGCHLHGNAMSVISLAPTIETVAVFIDNRSRYPVHQESLIILEGKSIMY